MISSSIIEGLLRRVNYLERRLGIQETIEIGQTHTHVEYSGTAHVHSGTEHAHSTDIDHGSISGIADDDHTQYLRTNGGRALTGTWDAGGQIIKNRYFYARDANGLQFRGGTVAGVTEHYFNAGGSVGFNTSPSYTFHFKSPGESVATLALTDVGNNPDLRLLYRWENAFNGTVSWSAGFDQTDKSYKIGPHADIGTNTAFAIGTAGWTAAGTVRALDAAGLSLQDDGGNAGLTVEDGGRVVTGDAGIKSPHYSGATRVLMNDDTATSFTPESGTGMIIVYDLSSWGSAREEIYGVLAYSTATGGGAALVAQRASRIEAGAGTLAGTTGTDTKFTVRAHTDGQIYLENRVGAAVYVGWIILGQSVT